MATEFQLYNVVPEELYDNQPLEKKWEIRYQMVMMALEKGNKPTARYFHTYPATVRRWVRKYQAYGIDGLKYKKNKQDCS